MAKKGGGYASEYSQQMAGHRRKVAREHAVVTGHYGEVLTVAGTAVGVMALDAMIGPGATRDTLYLAEIGFGSLGAAGTGVDSGVGRFSTGLVTGGVASLVADVLGCGHGAQTRVRVR